MRSASSGLRHPASASCLGRHSRLAGRCPNNSSLFPPLAAVVVVAAERLFLFVVSKLLFHGRGRGGKRQVLRRFLRKRGAAGEHCQSVPSSGATRHLPPTGGRLQRQRYSFRLKRKACGRACAPERADFPRPGEDVTAGDKKGNLSRSD